MSAVEAILQHAPQAIRDSAAAVFAASDFVAQTCAANPKLLDELIQSQVLINASTAADFAARWDSFENGAAVSESIFMSALRRWRCQEMLRIAWRDLAAWAPLSETLAELSAFADTAIRAAYQYARSRLCEQYGEPLASDGIPQSLLILAMGKLGGGELNFSSDIDLLFLFPEHGETAGSVSISNEEFFTRLGQLLIRLLNAATAEGLVFRVDMRLRPFGDSGPLVVSFAFLEDYLQRQGRDWERYAYIKARPITAQKEYTALYDDIIKPFVYRRYLDFGVFASLRDMKALIEREVMRRELQQDVKLGPGGIREIEFIVQTFQLIRGGRHRALQHPSLLHILPLLDDNKLLGETAVSELTVAYAFLRRLENRLQMLADQQTHTLPSEPAHQSKLAVAMGCASWDGLLQQLNVHRATVTRHFAVLVLNSADSRSVDVLDASLLQFWDSEVTVSELAQSLRAIGLPEAEAIAQLLLQMRAYQFISKLDELGRKRLQALLPQLLRQLAHSAAPLAVLQRVLRVLEAIGQRSVYFALLHESPAARQRLIELFAHGDFLARQIAAQPVLLDELLDEQLFSQLPDRANLTRELQQTWSQRADDDPEHQVEALCHFKSVAFFRIAVADLTGRLPLMQISDRLTDVAQLIIDQVIILATQQLVTQQVALIGSLAIVGYGKLAGMELGYSSDLDLVFLYDAPLESQAFYVRLAQRIVHLLTLHSAAGRLYEVDVRLRPSGKSGLLVSSIQAFAEYQQKDAWTWEHQALLHARALAGEQQLCERFEQVRLHTLQRFVRREDLHADVAAMRERMRRELHKASASEFDLKQGTGGVADIEFLAQYWALHWAREYPPVVLFADTIRQLESVASANLVPQETVDQLTAAYRAYRERTHHLALQGLAPQVTAQEFVGQRAAVTAIWQHVFHLA